MRKIPKVWHNIRELAYAYRLAARGLDEARPTVVIAHTVKGIYYGKLRNTADSHGMPLPHAEYVEAMKALAQYWFEIVELPAGPDREQHAEADY